MSDAFQTAADNVQKLAQKPTDDELLKLYGLYKQATEGDVTTTRPGVFDLKGKYKWDSWNEKKGTSKEDAKAQYIELVQKLIDAYGLKE